MIATLKDEVELLKSKIRRYRGQRRKDIDRIEAYVKDEELNDRLLSAAKETIESYKRHSKSCCSTECHDEKAKLYKENHVMKQNEDELWKIAASEQEKSRELEKRNRELTEEIET